MSQHVTTKCPHCRSLTVHRVERRAKRDARGRLRRTTTLVCTSCCPTAAARPQGELMFISPGGAR